MSAGISGFSDAFASSGCEPVATIKIAAVSRLSARRPREPRKLISAIDVQALGTISATRWAEDYSSQPDRRPDRSAISISRMRCDREKI